MPDKPEVTRIASAEEQSMTQIREILFGEQSRQTEQHFDRLETRLGKEMHKLRDELAAQEHRQGAALAELNATMASLLAKLEERLTLLDSDQQDARQAQQRTSDQQAGALHALEQRSVGKGRLADLLENLASELRGTPNQPAK